MICNRECLSFLSKARVLSLLMLMMTILIDDMLIFIFDRDNDDALLKLFILSECGNVFRFY